MDLFAAAVPAAVRVATPQGALTATTGATFCEPVQPAKPNVRRAVTGAATSHALSNQRRVVRRIPAVVQSSRMFEPSGSLFNRFTTMRVSTLRRRLQRTSASSASTSQQAAAVRMEDAESGDASKQNFISGLFRGWSATDADEDEDEISGDMIDDDAEYEDDMFPAPTMNGAGGYEAEVEGDEDYEEDESSAALGGVAAMGAGAARRKAPRGGMSGLTLEVVEPKDFSVDEANQAVVSLQDGKCVILNLSSMSREAADKFFSYVSGGCFALGLNHMEIAEDVYFFGPSWAKLTVFDGAARRQQQALQQPSLAEQPLPDSDGPVPAFGAAPNAFSGPAAGSSSRGLGWNSKESPLFPQLDWD